MTGTAPQELFDPFDPEYGENPYAQFRRLREAGPVLPSPLGGWQLFAYDDCFTLLRDPGTSVQQENVTTPTMRLDLMEQRMAARGVEQRGDHSILNLDPPDHTRLRRLVSRVFTPRAVEALRPRVQHLVDRALDGVETGTPFDLVSTLAFPLPFQVISLMLGMPDDGRVDELRDWSHTLVRSLDPVFDEDWIDRMIDANLHMREYLADVISWKRANPDDDLLSGLVAVHDDGDSLSDDELADQVALLFIAGHETTVNLIGNGALALARHPEQRRRVAGDPRLVPSMVEECLRYDPPVQMTRRITLKPLEVRGHEIPPGEFVMAMTAAANRDPARFGDDAETFDVGRADAGHHLTFGSGIHHCLGAALARLEGQVALGTLVARHPDYELAGDPVRNGRIVLRGLDELTLVV